MKSSYHVLEKEPIYQTSYKLVFQIPLTHNALA